MTRLYWWIQVFLRSFSHYFTLPLTLLLIIGLLISPVLGFGSSLGIPDVVNHDDLVKRIFAGCSLGVLWLAVLYCGYLLWLEDCREKRIEPPSSEEGAATSAAASALTDPPAAPVAAAEPALQVGFSRYAIKVSWCFAVTLVTVVGALFFLSWVAFNVANILHNPLPRVTVQIDESPVTDDALPGCDAPGESDSEWFKAIF